MKNKQIIVRCTYSDADWQNSSKSPFGSFFKKSFLPWLFASRCSIVVAMNGRLFREDSICT